MSLQLNTIVCADALSYLQSLPDESVDCIVTSPPYYALRDYGVEGQIGVEENHHLYVKSLCNIFLEARRVLKSSGSLWLNLGDSYSRDSASGHASYGKNGKQDYLDSNLQGVRAMKFNTRLPNKNLIGIPWRVAFALQDSGWYLRSEVIWEKPNAMPESVKDRPTRSHETVFLFTKSEKYYYNHEDVLEPYLKPLNRWGGTELKANGESIWDLGTGQSTYRNRSNRPNPKGRNARTVYRKRALGKKSGTVWSINTVPTKYGHFATMPQSLVERCILSSCPPNGVVLDPFMGSGTTAVVARRLSRNYIGNDINQEYVTIALDRLLEPFNVPMFE